jgi:lambda repressor-like predicted transcriptional regulator
MDFDQLEHFEEWKMIPCYEGLYEVSNWGRLRSLSGHIKPGKLLAPKISKSGYMKATLFNDGRRQYHLVHRLVAAAFIGPCPLGKEVDHGDGDRANNMVWNLSYLTRSENEKAAHKRRGNWSGCQPGERHWNAKLTNAQVTDIRRLKIEGMTFAAIAEMFGVHPKTIDKIVYNKRRAKG